MRTSLLVASLFLLGCQAPEPAPSPSPRELEFPPLLPGASPEYLAAYGRAQAGDVVALLWLGAAHEGERAPLRSVDGPSVVEGPDRAIERHLQPDDFEEERCWIADTGPWWSPAVDAPFAAGWYRQAAALGSTQAMLRLACLEREHRPAWLQQAADAGCPEGMWRLAEHYRDGRGVIVQDEAQARFWLRRALHDGGDGYAGCLLGGVLEASGRDSEAAEAYRCAGDCGLDELAQLLYRRRDLYRFGDPSPSKCYRECWFGPDDEVLAEEERRR